MRKEKHLKIITGQNVWDSSEYLYWTGKDHVMPNGKPIMPFIKNTAEKGRIGKQ